MYAIETTPHSGYYRIIGYPRGEEGPGGDGPSDGDWLLSIAPRATRQYGMAGPVHAWLHDERGDLHIFHAPARRLVATLPLGGAQDSLSCKIRASHDGAKLYALVREARDLRTLKIVDVEAGEIESVQEGFPGGWRIGPVERPDGKLLIEVTTRRDNTSVQGLVLFDPKSGERDYSLVEVSNGALGFEHPSPDGRYWIKYDPTSLPTLDIAEGSGRFLPWGAKQRYYGVSVQLWEAFPLRFVRRIAVAWLRSDELPDETGFVYGKRGVDSAGARKEVWDAIAETTERVNAEPNEPVPRSAFPAPFSSDDRKWKDIEQNWHAVLRGWASMQGWQSDSTAFWVRTNGFLSCIGVDGKISPRLYTARKGMAGGTWLPYAASWRDVVPLDGRKARAVYADGIALFDGAPSDAPHRWSEIPTSRDAWVALDNSETLAISRRVQAIKDEQKKIYIPLAAWTEKACIAAIEALTAKIVDDFAERAVDDEWQAVFTMGTQRFGEDVFFAVVREHFPRAAPAIRALIERYADANTGRHELFWKGEEGIAIFAHAVLALGQLDAGALSTLHRYGYLVDAEHEHFFVDTTLPALIRAHGWTDTMLDFFVWVMLRNFYNSLQDYNMVWSSWGFGDAVISRYTPQAFAARVFAEIDALKFPSDDPARYGHTGMDQLAKQISTPQEPWVVAFFRELERMAKSRETESAGQCRIRANAPLPRLSATSRAVSVR
ncbi:MAG: hypothetical protein RJB62_1664 [Pseudomonadota bacterium]|jgi:hypothetical protein